MDGGFPELLEKARCALTAADDAVDAARQAAEGHAGVLRVGMIAHALTDIVGGIFRM